VQSSRCACACFEATLIGKVNKNYFIAFVAPPPLRSASSLTHGMNNTRTEHKPVADVVAGARGGREGVRRARVRQQPYRQERQYEDGEWRTPPPRSSAEQQLADRLDLTVSTMNTMAQEFDEMRHKSTVLMALVATCRAEIAAMQKSSDGLVRRIDQLEYILTHHYHYREN
jgi:hypothetical protein